jgi:spermidine/putrescine transport system permease protein
MAVEERVRPKAPWLTQLVTVFSFLLLYIPMVYLITVSFLGVGGGTGTVEGQWTLEWYRRVLANGEVIQALRTSLVIGFWSTLGATLLGTSAALGLARGRFPGRRFLEILTHLPLIMPELVMGLAMLVWFVFLKMTLGTFSVVLAHITFCVSYVVITVKARLQGFDPQLEEAARDLGASPFQVFWRVTLPLIFPGVLSGALMAFTLSFDDFLITFFTAGVGNDTLPLKIYSMIKFGVSPEINALSGLLFATTALLVGFIFRRGESHSLKG